MAPGSSARGTQGSRSLTFVDSSRVRAGIQFRPNAERELYNLVEDALRTLPGPLGDVLVVQEMPGPIGVPDFTALLGGSNWIRTRQELAVPPILSRIDCSVISVLHNKRGLKTETVSRRLGWPLASVDNVIRRLVRIGAVESVPEGFISSPGLIPSGILIALEAKLRDWRRATMQGRNYRTWANNYVVVLGDVGPAAASRAQSLIGADRAGLYTVDGWQARPASRRPGAAYRLLGFEHLLSAIQSDPSL